MVSKASLAGNTTKECLLLHRKIPELTDEPKRPKSRRAEETEETEEPKQGDT